jgi:hypothetical protein
MRPSTLKLPAAAALTLALVALPAAPAASAQSNAPGGQLTSSNNTPFPSSKVIQSASWSTGRYDPPANQTGDILPTVWASDGSTYVMMDDGGVDSQVSGALWRQSLARVSGTPPNLSFTHVGDAQNPPPHTWSQIAQSEDNHEGPLGPYYSTAFTESGGVFYASQQRDWEWDANGTFTGLVGFAYSTDQGKHWTFGRKPFPAPLGNLTFIDTGNRGGATQDGYMYAIGTEREFNASNMLLGRVKPGPKNVTDPSKWEWLSGYKKTGNGLVPTWSHSITNARPALTWANHLTYPQMSYDRSLGRYLLTFSYSYSSSVPNVWTGGSELVIMEASKPWGPFSFVSRSPNFGPSNGYSAAFPPQWMSPDGTGLWLRWAANFKGCSAGLDCSGKYGFNTAGVTFKLAPPQPQHHQSVIPIILLSGSIPILMLVYMYFAPRVLRRPSRRPWAATRRP